MMLRISAPPLWLLVLLVLLVLILGALLVIGPWLGALPWWLRLRTSPANAKGITARPMMRTSLLPKAPTRALTPRMNNATQSVVLNPMRFAQAAAAVQATLRSEPLRLYVRFTPKSGHCQAPVGCPLCAKSRHGTSRVECTFRPNSQLTKVAGVAVVTETTRSSQKFPYERTQALVKRTRRSRPAPDRTDLQTPAGESAAKLLSHNAAIA
jgi:hypothetical protein